MLNLLTFDRCGFFQVIATNYVSQSMLSQFLKTKNVFKGYCNYILITSIAKK